MSPIEPMKSNERGSESDDRQEREAINVADAERIASSAGGGALIVYGLLRRTWSGAALALLGGVLAYRGLTGRCPLYQALDVSTAEDDEEKIAKLVDGRGNNVHRSITIGRTPEELFNFWRDFSKLPQFMMHLESVTVIDERRSHWIAKGPLDALVAWDAEIIDEVKNRSITWRSLPGSDILNAGHVTFEPVKDGTIVTVHLNYSPPLGIAGAAAAKILGATPASQIASDLRCFKQLMETHHVTTVEGQTSGRKKEMMQERKNDPASSSQAPEKRFAFGTRDAVEEASWESFPASDPPAW